MKKTVILALVILVGCCLVKSGWEWRNEYLDFSVELTVISKTGSISMATGVIVGTKDDNVYILTAAHVTTNAKVIHVFHNEGVDTSSPPYITYTARPTYDVAIIIVKSEIFAKSALPAPILFTKLPVGTTVWSIGNQLGRGNIPTFGAISNYDDYGWTSAPSLPGSSGGGIFYSGYLAGIVSSVVVGEDHQFMEHMVRFIPTADIYDFLKDYANNFR